MNEHSVLKEIGFYDYFKCEHHEDITLNHLRTQALISIHKNNKKNEMK